MAEVTQPVEAVTSDVTAVVSGVTVDGSVPEKVLDMHQFIGYVHNN